MSQVFHCQSCINFFGDGRCNAYPNGIPRDIIKGEHDHSEPYPGDNGIRFEPLDESDEAEGEGGGNQ